MRILFIHEVNYLKKVIYEMHEFPELLALRGHDITFLHYPEGGGKVGLNSTRRRIRGRAYEGAELTLVTPPTLGGGAAERYLAPLLAWATLRREIVHGDYDAIVLYAVPTTGWQTIRIARAAGVPVLFRALDVSHLIRRSAVSGLIRRVERVVYRSATILSANNPALLQYCVEESERSGPSEVHLPPLDFAHFMAGDGSAARHRWGIGLHERVILYMGSFFGFSGLETVISHLASRLLTEASLRLVLLGGGEQDELLRRIARDCGVEDRVLFTGVVPYADLPDHLAMADVAINPFRPQLVTDLALPHKVLQYIAAGLPVVSTNLRGLHAVMGDDHGITWTADPESAADAAASLAMASADLRHGLAVRQRERLTELFSVDGAVTALETSLSSLG